VTLRLQPDFIVGDMDSLPKALPKTWKKTLYWCDFDPERSDLDKALDFARSLGARNVQVAGVLGGGLDHELVNLAALEESGAGLDLTVIDGGAAHLLGKGRHRLPFKKGARFSLLAAPRARLSLAGARFGLKNELLRRGSRGLGNRAVGKVVLTVRQGRVWVVAQRGV
jgi:thiamine pyrophosphokinase